MLNFAIMSSKNIILNENPGIAIIAGKRNISYKQLLQRIYYFSTFTPQKKDEKTVIFCENREGWIYAFYSILKNKGIAVPVDVMSTVSEVVYILNDCKPSAIWTSVKKADLIKEALKEAELDIPILLIEEYETVELPADYNYDSIDYNDDDLAVIIYTSGTTGSPKGVMLSYRNLMANVHSVSIGVPIFQTSRRTMILLPLHHVLPLLGSVIAPLFVGGGVAICPTMTAPDIMETLKIGKVAILIGVPRLYQTLFKGMKAKIDASPVTRFLFWICKKAHNRSLSRFIFQSVRKKMGGHITFLVSGGAALDKEIGEGLKILGLDVLEGYGMSEFAPMISFTRPGDIIPGCSGLPVPCVDIKFKDGELCAKGPNMMMGYYNKPEETAQVIDDEGYLHTGDLGYMDEKGHVFITGRNKEIIVLSNGKNINPSEIEYKLEKYADFIKEIAVLQDGDMLKAIIVPHQSLLAKIDEEIEEIVKANVLQDYNANTAPYKKIMSMFIYRGDLPRTRLDKIQRFKLQEIIKGGKSQPTQKERNVIEPSFKEYQLLKNYLSNEKKCEVKPTDHLETDLALDSLDKVSLQAFLEMTFGVEIDQDKIASFKNVTELSEYIVDEKKFIENEKIDWKSLIEKNDKEIILPRTWWTIHVISNISKFLNKCYFRISVKGIDNVPLTGPVILAPNHQSFFDGLFAMEFLKGSIIKNTYFYAKDAHVKNKFLKMVAQRHNVIVMSNANLKLSILQLAEVLKQGKNVIIFPEGTRTNDGELGDFKKMFAILSKELNVPIIPVVISGAYKALPRGSKFPRPTKVNVEYLAPYTPQAHLSYNEIANEVREMIESKLQ